MSTDAIALDGSIGLNPKLAKLAARFRAGQVAIVEGVGYPDPNLSHFASLAYWWSGTPGESGNVGWLGRYLDGTVGFDDPLAAVGIGPVPSPALLGTSSFATSITDTTGLQPALPGWADSRRRSRRGVVEVRAGVAGPDDAARASARGDRSHREGAEGPERRSRDRRYRRDRPERRPRRRAAGTTGAAPSVAESLRLAAQLVAAKHAPRVIYVSGLGDYDTHQGQAQRHPVLMTDLDEGVDAFFTTLDQAHSTGHNSVPARSRALVMTVSEFGRRPGENGSGTDHGTAAPHFFIGTGVKGGRYGTPPSLTSLDDHGNLVHTVDFRALYATAVQGWLGVDAEAVVGKGFEPLPVLS